MECKDCQYMYAHPVYEGDVDEECTSPDGICPFEEIPVTCSWCSWSGFIHQLNTKQILNPKTLEDIGEPCCPRCGSHTTLEY